MKYSHEVLSRVRDPKLAGELPTGAPDVGTGEAGRLDEGTVARVSIRVDPVTRRIRDARFKVFGCSAAIASASLVVERLEDQSIDQPMLSPADVVTALALPGEKVRVAALAVEAAGLAVSDWRRKERDRDH
jgi:NifU-like protein involved in Fe-S cluster formation